MTETARTHGLDGALVEPDWPPLAADEVHGLLRGFGCAEPVQILTVSPRPFSAASVVACGARRLFVKRHHRAVRSREGLGEEHRFMAHLLAHGLSVPRVLADGNGETAIEQGEWTYEVHEVPAGVDLYADALSWTPFFSSAHARSAGEALARLHCAAEGFDAPRRRVQPLVAGFTIFAGEDPRAALDEYLGARPGLKRFPSARRTCIAGLNLLAPFHAELKPLLPAFKPLWTHNDLHGSNLLWDSDSADSRAVAVIDFGLADRTCAVHDIAQAIERSIVEWLDLLPGSAYAGSARVHLDHLAAFLDGYAAVRPLAAQEAAALAPMTALCHAEFALTEADYFCTVLHSDEKTMLALDDYLAGHARWFRGNDGQRLLDWIRAWAAAREPRPAGVSS
ncbi:MAG: phosphotransferase [Terracidiphilus sp.]